MKNTFKEKTLKAKLEYSEQSVRKIALADTAGNITYSLIVGSILDYFAGLNFVGIVASRASATAMNSVTGGPYGWWREKAFKVTKTNEESGRIRKTLVDLLAFNTFQVPVYATAIVVGSFVSVGYADIEKIRNGATYLTIISPVIGPTIGWWVDGCRKLFRVKSAAEGAYTGSKARPPE